VPTQRTKHRRRCRGTVPGRKDRFSRQEQRCVARFLAQEESQKCIEVDCERQVVIPGFVRFHTHPAFVAPRLVDFEKRVAGATYEEIAKAGGGIRSSVEAVRKAGEAD